MYELPCTTLYLLACFARISYRFTCFTRTTCTCVLWRDNFKENRENCHDFIVLYCVRNWEGISVVENLDRHNNHSFRANKLVIVSPQLQARKRIITIVEKTEVIYFPLG